LKYPVYWFIGCGWCGIR